MTPFPDALFPSRPIRARRSVFNGGIINLLSGLLLVGVATGLVIWQAPGVWRDYRISQDPMVVQSSAIDGACETWRLIFTTCEADLRYSIAGKAVDTHVSFAFIDFSSGDYTVEAVASRSSPSLATLDLGLDMLWNRIAVGAGFALLMGGLGLSGLFGALRTFRRNAAARRGGPVTPVALEVTQVQKVIGGKIASYRLPVEGKTKSAGLTTRMRRADEPLWIATDEGSAQALGVRMEGVGAPILLDEGLTRLDLTAEEQARLRAALHPSPAV